MGIDDTNYFDGMEFGINVHPHLHKVFFTGATSDGTPELNLTAFQDIESNLNIVKDMIDAIVDDIYPCKDLDLYLKSCSAIL